MGSEMKPPFYQAIDAHRELVAGRELADGRFVRRTFRGAASAASAEREPKRERAARSVPGRARGFTVHGCRRRRPTAASCASPFPI